MEEEVTVKKPEAWVSRSETKDDVSIIGDSDGVLRWGQVSLLQMTFEETSSVEVESVLQVDFLDVLVRWPSDTDHVERVSVQVERMR